MDPQDLMPERLLKKNAMVNIEKMDLSDLLATVAMIMTMTPKAKMEKRDLRD